MRDSIPANDVRVHAGASPACALSRGRSGSVDGRVHLGTAEPPSVALFRQVLNPTVIVLTLLGCVLVYSQPLTPHYLALAALTFLISSQVASHPVLHRSANRGLSALLRHRIYAEWLVVSAALLLLAFAFKVTEEFSRRVILTWFVVTPFVVVAAQAGFRRYAQYSALRGRIVQSHVIVGANECGRRLALRLMANPHLGKFKGFFDDRDPERLTLTREPVLGRMKDVAGFVRAHAVSNLYLCLPMRPDPRVMALLDELKDTTASVYFVPDIFAFDLIQAQVSEFDGIPLLAVCESPFAGMNGVLKRASDIVFSCVLLLLLWPLMLAIAVGVRLDSPGPVLFAQRRYGLYGEAITVYKFRSMRVNQADETGEAITQARRDDPRVTSFGRLLRRTSLDELAQLFNVLGGTMSLVGPRPHVVSQNEEYRKLIDGYMLRYKVRPGITGWAQVNGLRGETEAVEKMQRRVEYDLDYLRHWSLSLDLLILIKTARVVLRDRNAY
jgi:putative colanic acid biosynthesis UDP-glucose lipid carrier transferase